MQPATGTYHPPIHHGVTSRELEVILLIAQDLENKEIAHRLHLSIKTVEFHKTKIYQRLGVSGPAGVTRWAIREGHLTP